MAIGFQCRCGQGMKIADEHAGKVVRCKTCGAKLKVPRPKKRQQPSAQTEIFALDDDEFDVVSDPPQDTGKGSRKAGSKKKTKTKQPEKKTKPRKKSDSNTGLIVGIAVGSVVLLAGIVFGAMQFFGSASQARVEAKAAPINYTSFRSENGMFQCEYPEGWEEKSGGGTGGIPPFASFSKDNVFISIKDNQKGSAVADMAQAGGSAVVLPGDDIGFEERPPAASVHEFMGDTVFSFQFDNFEEEEGSEYVIPYGTGWLSEFTATEGLFGSKIKAYRLTLVSSKFQYTVICKCPVGKWEENKPLFEHVMQSISR